MLSDYPHLSFTRRWKLSDQTLINLGQCAALVECLAGFPIEPKLQERLRVVSFSRGAQATTAIEGNTLTDDELRRVLDGQELPKSRHYQATEVRNALAAMNHVWELIIQRRASGPMTPRLLQTFNEMIGKNLGRLFDGVPGRWRADRRSVGRYLAPPHEAVPELMNRLCQWLRDDFRFEPGSQSMPDAIVQAVVGHVYFEWIHPFSDGNGRTGRLLEFYILLRSGLPDVAAHVLANHYNQTRSEYAAHFDNARKKRDLSEFIAYAAQGMRDGLSKTLAEVQADAFRIVWRSYVYDRFAEYADYRKRSVYERRRTLALLLPAGDFTLERLLAQSEELIKLYKGGDWRTLRSDLKVLCDLGLAEPAGHDFRATHHLLRTHLASRAARHVANDVQ